MAYTGLTYKKILELSITIAKKNGFQLEYAEAVAFIDEAILEVWMDVNEDLKIYTGSWPSNNTLDLDANGIMLPKRVFADSKEMVYMYFDDYREVFLGDQTKKSSIDNNLYFSVFGDTLYLEPDVTGVTNLIIHYVPYITEYSKSNENNEPEIPEEYRILIPYKIVQMSAPFALRGVADRVYKDMLRSKKAFKSRKRSAGQAVFYDPFEGSDSYRRGKV